MKRLSTVGGLTFLLAATFAIVCSSQAERTKHEATAQQKTPVKHEIRVTDQNGNRVVSGRPSGTGQIVDVQVGPAFAFDPSTVNINVGDTVRWTWAGSGHSVTSGDPCTADGDFCSPDDTNCALGTLNNIGFVYEHTFVDAGTFSYFCFAHCAFGMTGTVNVGPASTPTPSSTPTPALTPTPTPTPIVTPTAIPSATPTVTPPPTATPTVSPTVSPTPSGRPRPTPRPRPTLFPRPAP